MITFSKRFLPLLLGIVWIVAAPRLAAHHGSNVWAQEAAVNGELERYLRILQLVGRVDLQPWTVRGLTPTQGDRLLSHAGGHPWRDRYPTAPEGPRATVGVIDPMVETIYNSGFPDGSGRGAVWAGRGATLSASGGVLVRQGALSLKVMPTLFWTQNADFRLIDNARTEDLPFSDGFNAGNIDLPQRFGERPYGRVDAGQSELRIDAGGAAVGISSASQHWGPAVRYPIVLGDRAPGFLHAFAGTSEPAGLGIGAVHGKVLWGVLRQSEFSPMGEEGDRRFMAGLVGTITLRWIPGLELGGSRFFHVPWPDDGFGSAHLLKPLEGFFKAGLTETGFGPDGLSDPDNQIASIFGRWVFPRSGFEVYGEYGREDHNIDLRDLILQPDHNSAYLLGLGRAWARADGTLLTVRGELVNARRTHLEQSRWQTPFYVHAEQRQGHTHRGQLLGADAVYGGAGGLLSVELHHASGRYAAYGERVQRHAPAAFEEGEPTTHRDIDVVYSVGAESLRFRGRFDVLFGAAAAWNLNRGGAGDAFNLRGQARVVARL